MKRLVWLLIVVVALIGCQKKHPVRVYVDPAMTPDAVEQVAVFSFTSLIHQADDPDGQAPRMLEEYFMPELDKRNDYKFIAPNSVAYAIQSEDLEERTKKFLNDWPISKQADSELLSKLAQRLNCDAFLIPVVDLWQKDEADYQENTTPATYVGATITIVSADNGTVLFEASDEDYIEGARTETDDRSIVRGGSGRVAADYSAKLYRAPPFDGVVQKVVAALALSLPAR